MFNINLDQDEEIRDIAGYEGLYAITSHGRVWSYRYNAFMKLKIMPAGYRRIGLRKNGKQKLFSVHRLVAQAFLANPDGLPQVNHKDENKANNCVDNLEWCDAKYNNNYGTRNARLRKKLARRPVRCVELNKVYDGVEAAAREFKLINGCHIGECCRGKRNICAGYHWEYVEYVEKNDTAIVEEKETQCSSYSLFY